MDLKDRLWELWELPEDDRKSAVATLQKIFGNILSNPDNPKFKDLNFSKIRKKFSNAKAAFYLLFTAGFSQNVDGTRLVFQYTTVNMKMLRDCNDGLTKKIANPNDKSILPKSKLPKETEDVNIKDKQFRKNFQSSSKAKHEREEKEKQEYLDRQASLNVSNENANNADNSNNNNDINNNNNSNQDSNNNNNSNENGDNNGDAQEQQEDTRTDEEKAADAKNHEEVRNALLDDLDDGEKELLRQIQEMKGTTVKLSMDELAGKSKEEKVAIFKKKQQQFRQEKAQAERRAQIDREKRRRENVKLAQETKAKREEQQRAMIARKKEREKKEEKLRRQRIKEKIKKEKEAKKREKEAKAKAQAAAAAAANNAQ